MRLIDGTDWTDVTPEMPPIFGGLAPMFEVAGALAAAAVMFIATLAALFILIKADKGGPVLAYAAAVLLSVVVSAMRADWSALVYSVLVLPAFFGIRWLFRKISARLF
jgi:hypothetical protein